MRQTNATAGGAKTVEGDMPQLCRVWRHESAQAAAAQLPVKKAQSIAECTMFEMMSSRRLCHGSGMRLLVR